MHYRHVLPRRTFLRGAAGVAIALPFLEEMRARSLWAAEPLPQPRCVTVFFAEGCGNEFVAAGLKGPLAPWKRLVETDKKMAIYGSVRQPAAFHEAAGCAALTACFRNGNNPTGASIDQHILRAAYPGGVPTPLQSFSMGMYFRRLEAWRHIHSWTAAGQPADIPADTPSAVFRRLFGANPAPTPGIEDPAVARERAYTRSVLDTVLVDYKRLTSTAGGLGSASREKLRSHLDRLETLEKQAAAMPSTPGTAGCSAPRFTDPHFLGDDLAEKSATVTPAEVRAYWTVMADLYALGLHCDLVRFGNVMFGGAAERYKLKGPATFDGQPVTFNDTIDLHEQFHASPPGAPQTSMLWHLHFIMEQVTYFLDRLDDKSYAVNGKTYLDQHPVVVTTELGNGSQHECERVFHAVSSAGGRFKTGLVNASQQIEAVDFYNGIVAGLGISTKMGELGKAKGTFTGLLA